MLRWSLEVLGTGKWPATDHNGEPWPEGSTRAARARAGEDLAEGWVALFWEIVGDWKWLAEAVGFKSQKRYYNCNDICHKCAATIKRSLGGIIQVGLDNRILRFGLARWGIEAARS